MSEPGYCEKCGYYFSKDDTVNEGKVWYEGYIIGWACDKCQLAIWRKKEGDKE